MKTFVLLFAYFSVPSSLTFFPPLQVFEPTYTARTTLHFASKFVYEGLTLFLSLVYEGMVCATLCWVVELACVTGVSYFLFSLSCNLR